MDTADISGFSQFDSFKDTREPVKSTCLDDNGDDLWVCPNLHTMKIDRSVSPFSRWLTRTVNSSYTAQLYHTVAERRARSSCYAAKPSHTITHSFHSPSLPRRIATIAGPKVAQRVSG